MAPVLPEVVEDNRPARPPRFRRLRSGLGDWGTAAALGITFGVLIVVGGAVGLISNWNGIGQAIGPTCSFGITGTAASITVHGWGAGDACKALRSGASFQTYDLPAEAGQPVVCSYPVLNDRIVVRDQPSESAGGTLCAALHDALVTPRTSASP